MLCVSLPAGSRAQGPRHRTSWGAGSGLPWGGGDAAPGAAGRARPEPPPSPSRAPPRPRIKARRPSRSRRPRRVRGGQGGCARGAGVSAALLYILEGPAGSLSPTALGAPSAAPQRLRPRLPPRERTLRPGSSAPLARPRSPRPGAGRCGRRPPAAAAHGGREGAGRRPGALAARGRRQGSSLPRRASGKGLLPTPREVGSRHPGRSRACGPDPLPQWPLRPLPSKTPSWGRTSGQKQKESAGPSPLPAPLTRAFSDGQVRETYTVPDQRQVGGEGVPVGGET